MTFFRGELQFLDKNKLKSGIFNNKNSSLTRIICSVITKNSNWEILTKDLLVFKKQDGVKKKKVIYLKFTEKSKF